jgi:hypothetical protein
MMHPRFAPLTSGLLALALVPTVIHNYLGLRAAAPLTSADMPAVLGSQASRPTDRSPRFGTRKFGTDDWVERWYGDGQRLRLFVAHGDDPKALYHHPELAISYPESNFERGSVARLPGRPEVPVFVLRGEGGSPDLVAYALRSGGAYIDEPVRWQFLQALRLLWSGRAPLALIYVHDTAATTAPLDQQPALLLLRDALAAYEALERTTPPAPAPATAGAPSAP